MKKIYFLFTLLFASLMLQSQTTYIVSSNADSGEGTLRDIITQVAFSGDSIVIQNDIKEIILESEIQTDKSLKINGNGCILRVIEPKVSASRVLCFISADETTIIDVGLYNLVLKGGDISAGNGNQEKNGGALYVKRANLTLENCTLTGKAYDGGGLAGENCININMNGCIFDANVVTHNHAALVLGGFQIQQIRNSVFKNNDALAVGGCSAVDVSSGSGIFSGCIFEGNVSKTGRGGSALSIRSKDGSHTVSDCSFLKNINNGTDGGVGVTKQEGGSLVLENCTFYDNFGGRGSYYHYAGSSVLVNCTFSANRANHSDAKYGGGLYAANTGSVTLINNIFAYNFNQAYGTKDVYATGVAPGGTNNIMGVQQGANGVTNTIGFIYAADPTEDSPLFETYTTTGDSYKIPVLDMESNTIHLSATSVAIGAGISDHAAINIPTKDARGEVRHATAPCLGSWEKVEISGAERVSIPENLKIEDNRLIVNAENEKEIAIYNGLGQLLIKQALVKGENHIAVNRSGVVIVRIGNKTTKIVINP